MVVWEVGAKDTRLFFFRVFSAISGEFFGSTFFSLLASGAKFVNVLLGFVIVMFTGSWIV
jgi:hypothetical protein